MSQDGPVIYHVTVCQPVKRELHPLANFKHHFVELCTNESDAFKLIKKFPPIPCVEMNLTFSVKSTRVPFLRFVVVGYVFLLKQGNSLPVTTVRYCIVRCIIRSY